MENDENKVEQPVKLNTKKVAANLVIVFLSNFLTILSGVLVGFVVPKIMSVPDYGFYKTYTLYATYIGLFHFGFSDGIYLYFSGKNYEDLNKGKFRTYTRFITLLSLAFSVITILVGLLAFDSQMATIFVFIGVNIFSTHLTLYFQGIVQCTSRFKELSLKNTIQSLINILAIVILFVLYKTEVLDEVAYYIYLYIVTGVNYFICFWYLIKYREIAFGKCEKLGDEKPIFEIIKLGFPLLIGNLIGTLIMTIDRQFISVLFDTETYAIYAFAYNMVSLVTVAVSALSVVLYPTMKQVDTDSIKKNYSFLNAFFLMAVFLVLVAYFVLHVIVSWFIPNYIGSLIIFRVIFPGIALTSSITIIMYNIYKIFNKTFLYFIISASVFVLSIVANVIAYFIFKTPISISVASIIVIVIWYIATEIPIIVKFKINTLKHYIYIAVMLASFYLTTMIEWLWLGALSYVCAWIAATLIIEWKEFLRALKLVASLFKRKKQIET